MPNKYRSETEIILCGKKYIMRPTFSAIVEFEEKAGAGIFSILTSAAGGREDELPSTLTMKIVAAAVWAGIRGGCKSTAMAPSYDEVGELIFEHGVQLLLPTVMLFLSSAVMDKKSVEEAERAIDHAEDADSGNE